MQFRRRIHFHLSLVSIIVLLVVIMTVATVAAVVVTSNRTITESAEHLFSSAGALARERTTTHLEGAQRAAATAAAAVGVDGAVVPGEDHPAVSFFFEHLNSNPDLYSIYAGHSSGDFLQVIHTRGNEEIPETHRAPAATEYIVRTIGRNSSGRRVQHWRFYDIHDDLLGSREEDNASYDPREREWYRDAMESRDNGFAGRTVLSDVYVFDSLQAPGITAARALPSGEGVLGVDMTLERLEEFIYGEEISPGGGALIADHRNRVLVHHPNLDALLGDSAADSLSPLPGDVEQPEAHQGWLVYRDVWTRADGKEWVFLAGAPTADFLGPYVMIRNRVILIALLVLALSIPFTLWIARRMTWTLSEMAAEVSRIKELDFSPTPRMESSILEFDQLSRGFSEMKTGLFNRTKDLNVSLDQLATIVELNIAISAEQNIDRLSELILEGARTISHADGGSLYLINPDTRALEFIIVLNDTLGFKQGGTSGTAVTLPPVPMYSDDGSPNEHNVVSHTVHHEQTVNIADAYNAGGEFDFSGTRRFDEANGYRTESVLTVPLKPRGSDIIGVIQLLNAKDTETGRTIPFTDEIQRFVEALSAGAATALYNRDLIEEQRRLFEAMIQLIAGAIDAKSPYTGGHCARVPEIALMLARKAEAAADGALKDFSFPDDQEWRAFRIGAWLHDAGKVTTPDFVVDKATKLETIYNRIHEIRTRFEVLLRDARIARHEAVMAGADAAEEDARLEETERELREDFAFIAECNVGGEFMAPDRLERLRSIAGRRWMRHFDDTIGLSWEEQQRRDAAGERTLPAEERLLEDKPEHLIPRTDDFYRQYEQYGFTLPVPEHLYNLGEIYNLSVGRGTLTDEERFKINEHVMQTIVMLDRLPFPGTLANVPEYAGTHHETLNGSGYPRQLTGEDLSIPARIMAIADIFEALTASDRPYKKAKPLSVAIDILAKFKQDGHIDGDLFDLFLTSGVYREYAERYLKPEQVDEVDIKQYLG
jgi:HD-GYP domain-containing protein (c-di-GMP phosphodiesterase class II)